MFYNRPSSNLVATSSSSSNAQPWILDTGATHHLTSHLDNLSLNSEYSGPDSVKIGNGTSLPITHTGSSSVSTSNNSFLLDPILHVPDSCCNLLSVFSFTTANQVSVEFFPDHYLIKDIHARRILHSGQNNDGLYSILFDTKPAINPSPSIAFLASSFAQWHNILGHANNVTVRKVLNQFHLPSSSNKSEFACHACNISKSHRLPFTLFSFHAKHPLELIYSDLWGPSPIPTIDGSRYYVLFYDHYSKYTWIYFLKYKYDVLNVFIKIWHIIEKVFYHSKLIGEDNSKHSHLIY